MRPPIGTIIVARDIGAGWGAEQVRDLALALEQRLRQSVMISFLESEDYPVVDRVESLVVQGNRRIVILPVGLLPITETSAVGKMISWLKHKWPAVHFHVAAPLTWWEWSRWLRTTALDQIAARSEPLEHSGLLLVGHATSDPMSNANLARLAHLVGESSSLAATGYAFLEGVRPHISESLRTMAATGISSVLVLPWLIRDAELLESLENDLERTCESIHLRVFVLRPTLANPAFVNLLVSNHYAALSGEIRFPDQYVTFASGKPASENDSKRSDNPASEAEELNELDRRLNELLPPQYEAAYEQVSTQSMGTASLKYDDQGRVAWGEIWTSFCDLALAGGPPHRGTLLEAVPAADAMAEREQYDAVVAEIERGIQLVTSLPVVRSETLGWVGVRCENEEMAVWLMRAIIVENIMVRREKEVIYLPAGPRFAAKREIKNVITAVAKTVHYWLAHLNARQQSQDSYE